MAHVLGVFGCTTADGTVIGIADGMMSMTAEETETVVSTEKGIKRIRDWTAMSELVARRHCDTSDIKNDCPAREAE